MGMTVDFSDFEKRFTTLVQWTEPKATAEGLFRAGSALIQDAIEETPKVPFDEGHLRGSGKVTKADLKKGYTELAAGFNKEYAARWHELTPEEDARIDWTLPGSGRKYLETKLVQHKADYMEIVAKYLKRVLGGR